MNHNRIYLFFIMLLFIVSNIFVYNGLLGDNKNYKVNFGLELIGGSSLTLQADFDEYLKNNLSAFSDDLKKTLAFNKVIPSSITTDGKSLSVSILFDKKNFPLLQERKVFNNMGKQYSIKYEDNNKVKLTFNKDYISSLKSIAINEAKNNIAKRIDSLGTKEISLENVGTDKILLQAPGFDNPTQLKNLIGKTAKLTFHLVDDADDKSLKKNLIYIKDKIGREFSLHTAPILDGQYVKNAVPNYNQKHEPVVIFNLNKEGAKIFEDFTEKNIGRAMAIVIDKEVLSVATIRDKIPGGNVELSGSFSFDDVVALSSALKAGALPIKLNIIEEKLVGAAAGSELISKGQISLLVAFLLVTIFMTMIYGILGIVASFAIYLNLLLVVSFMILTSSTMSLAGVAGMVLMVGIVVDNNVLVFERIREELRFSNKAYVSATRAGFSRALSTIIDSNLTTIIAAAILLWFGDSNIKGFSISLIYGIIFSFFSTTFVARVIIENFQNFILGHSFPKFFKKLLPFNIATEDKKA